MKQAADFAPYGTQPMRHAISLVRALLERCGALFGEFAQTVQCGVREILQALANVLEHMPHMAPGRRRAQRADDKRYEHANANGGQKHPDGILPHLVIKEIGWRLVVRVVWIFHCN